MNLMINMEKFKINESINILKYPQLNKNSEKIIIFKDLITIINS